MGRWMKGTFASVEELSAYIDSTVDSIMQNEIAKGLKKAVKEKAKKNVYDSYDPIFMSRDYEYGGILDESFMYTYYSRPELTLEHIVAWQQLGFRKTNGRQPGDLVDTIEKNGLYHAPPRPYMEEAGDSYVAEKADDDMQKALNKAGL